MFSPIFLTETIFFGKIWGSKKGLKVAFFVKNYCYAQNGVNGVSLGPKSTKWAFLNLFIGFFSNCNWWRVKKWVKWLFWIFRNIFLKVWCYIFFPVVSVWEPGVHCYSVIIINSTARSFIILKVTSATKR